ncbi:hypothetical protein [Paraburkholderia kirstenboschensis]|uniref:hypothetical protein n=1 Tax=Paraburkholderia kirstenboschensis TaxID=1245436 RepID=UPI000ACE9DAC|nr:hypothetical protein [Paraburkholderia kirstenboschensis]
MLRSPANGKCAQSIILPRPQPVGRGAAIGRDKYGDKRRQKRGQKRCGERRYSGPSDGYQPTVVKRITGLEAPAPGLIAIGGGKTWRDCSRASPRVRRWAKAAQGGRHWLSACAG